MAELIRSIAPVIRGCADGVSGSRVAPFEDRGEESTVRQTSLRSLTLIKEPRMRWTGNTLGFVAGLLALSISPGVAFAASSINGTVTFDGKPPAMKPLAMDADPACAKKHTAPVLSEALVLGNGQT